MWIYAALTVAGVLAAAVCVWVVKSMVEASKSAYKVLTPGGGKEDAQVAHLNSTLSATPAPWGWNGGQTAPAGAAPASGAGKRKTRDWSERVAFEKSNAAAAQQRHEGSPARTSVRNVLAGYDMDKPTQTQVPPAVPRASQPSLEPKTLVEQAEEAERPSKPWGW
ncbi:MAG: hypothetical protein HRU51_03500 [Xanthomonadales bacterium]|nr:hypothetical protein [Xanthomonadales bacterium]